MKITQEFLREIIKEAIEEADVLTRQMSSKVKKHSKGIPSGGFHVPPEPVEPGDWGSDIPDEEIRIRKLSKMTGVPSYKGGKQFKTKLAEKGYYIEHFTGLETYMIGPFATEEEAREEAKGIVGSRKKTNKAMASKMDMRKKPDYDEFDEEDDEEDYE
jgi:hypothetical protein